MCRSSIFKFVFALYVLSAGDLAWACSCFGGLHFEEQAKNSTILVLGRVRVQGAWKSTHPEVAYLDVEIVEAFKGKTPEGVVRIWDSYVGTNCGGGLHALSPGTLAVFSVDENKGTKSLPELWETTGIRPGADDYLLGTCSEYWKVFRTERGARRYMKRLLH